MGLEHTLLNIYSERDRGWGFGLGIGFGIGFGIGLGVYEGVGGCCTVYEGGRMAWLAYDYD